jgi:branched-chain amino acid aminotransferase
MTLKVLAYHRTLHAIPFTNTFKEYPYIITSMKVYFNGEIMEEGEAHIPFLDRGVLFGDGLFETIRAYQGKPFRLKRHLSRLREGCRKLRLSGLPGDREIEGALAELYGLNVGEGDAYMRITLTGGAYDGRRTLARPSSPNTLMVVKPYEGYPTELYEKGVRAVVSSIRRNEGSPLSRIKSNNYLDTIMAKHEAWERGADDAIMLNGGGYLAEGTSSNLFLVKGEEVFTPDIACGLLPGVTRDTVLELCEELGLAAESGFYTLDDLLGADEAFLTVSTAEIVPIAEVEGRAIGSSCPGPVTARLSLAYRELVREELGL